MSLLSFCEWLQDTWVSTTLRESIWGYPIVGAIHVLGIAWFGAAAFIKLDEEWRWFKRLGISLTLISGALLFWCEPVECYGSRAFWVKMALLVCVGLRPPKFSWALWIGIIFASRAIAFF